MLVSAVFGSLPGERVCLDEHQARWCAGTDFVVGDRVGGKPTMSENCPSWSDIVWSCDRFSAVSITNTDVKRSRWKRHPLPAHGSTFCGPQPSRPQCGGCGHQRWCV